MVEPPATPSSALSVLDQAIKQVPTAKWAYMTVAAVAVVFLVTKLGLGYREAFLGAIAVFALMFVGYVFHVATIIDHQLLSGQARFLSWIVTVVVAGFIMFLPSSMLFGWPRDFKHWLGPDRIDPTISINTTETPAVPTEKVPGLPLKDNKDPILDITPFDDAPLEKYKHDWAVVPDDKKDNDNDI